MTENIDLKEREFIDNHPILLTHTVSRKFIFRHYENCYYFIKELLESESITVREHRILKDLLKSKIRNETRGKHILPFVTGALSLRAILLTKSNLLKTLIALGYYFFIFNMTYSLGIHLSNFIQFPGIFKRLMNLNQGGSIQSMQTKLFIKKCLLDEYREDHNTKEKAKWKDSFVLNEVVVKNYLNARKSLFLKSV